MTWLVGIDSVFARMQRLAGIAMIGITSLLNIRWIGLLALSFFLMECELSATEPAPAVRAKTQKVELGEVKEFILGMQPAAIAGYNHLLNSVYLPADFDQEVLDRVGAKRFESPLRDLIQSEKPTDRFFQRFGLTPRPDEPDSGKPLQYVVTRSGEFVMNCFACHGGSVYGTPFPGAPNNAYALESLTDQVRREKLVLNKPLGHMDVGSVFMPLGTSVGTTNAVMFGVALMNFRDADLNVLPLRPAAAMTHHDMDPPPWWHFHKKKQIYIDGFAEKGHRGLMQFMLVRQNGPEKFRRWETDFRTVFAFISSLRPPKYPLAIDAELAGKGEMVFNEHCSQCHGTYGEKGTYPELTVAIDEIGTDRVRLDSLSAKHREAYGKSWFALYGKQNTIAEPTGYVAPPLDGVWASAPYLHNGSVPTLWHLLNPEQRPTIWQRTAVAMDEEKVGLQIESVDEIPAKVSSEIKRTYFDSRKKGKSNAGHNFPSELSEEQKRAVLEYLKTL